MKAEINFTRNIHDIFFPVRIEKTEDITPNMTANPKCQYAVVGTLDGIGDRVLSYCGDRYNLVTNHDLLMPILDLLGDYKYDINIRTSNHSTFEIKIHVTDQRLALKVGAGADVIYPMIGFNRSYDSGSKYFLYAGYYRLICSNGLVAPVENTEHFEIRGKHTDKLNKTLAKIEMVVGRILENSKEVSKKFEVMYDTKVENYGERVIEVMNAVGLNPVRKNKKSEDNTKNLDHVLATIRTEMAKLGETKANNWLIYNGINRYIFDEEMNVKSDDVRKKLDREVFKELAK